MAGRKPRRTSTLGTIYQNATGGWVARYDRHGQRHTPGRTFLTHKLADEWLTSEQLLIARDTWTPPAERRAAKEAAGTRDTTTLDELAREWIDARTTSKGTPLAPRTIREYRAYLSGRLATLADHPVADIDRGMIDRWWQDNQDAPGLRHHCYAFLKSVMASAADRGIIAASPCRIENASRRAVQRPKALQNDLITGLTPLDIGALTEATKPAQWRALVLLLAYSGLRVSEALALTQSDLIRATGSDGTPHWTIRVTKALSVTSSGQRGPQPPKTPESIRFVPLPPHVAEALAEHMTRYAVPGPDGPLFPSTNAANPWPTVQQVMGTSAKQRAGKGRRAKPRTPTGFNAARIAIGRPELRVHDLRRWARHMWRKAGLGDADCEQLLGHVLDPVMGAYVTLDREALWLYMERLSELAGWTPPAATPGSAPGIDPRLLAVMTAEQIRTALAHMSDDEIAAVVPLLDPEALARAIIGRTPPAAD